MKKVASVVNTSHVTAYLNLRDEMLVKLFNLQQFLIYSQENVDFLTYITEEFLSNLDDFHQANVFICQSCGREAVEFSPCQESILENCTPPPNFLEE